MKNTKRILITVAACAVLAAILAFSAMAETKGQVAPNTLGDKLTWTITDSGELLIEGTATEIAFDKDAEGKGVNWNNMGVVPWYAYRDSIKSVKVTAPITKIGLYSFAYLTNLEKAVLPTSLKNWDGGYNYFGGCSILHSVTFGTEYGEDNVIDLTNLTECKAGGNQTFETAGNGKTLTVKTPENGVVVLQSSKFFGKAAKVTVYVTKGSEMEKELDKMIAKADGKDFCKEIVKAYYGDAVVEEKPDDTKPAEKPRQTIQETKTATAVYGTPTIDGIIEPMWDDVPAIDFPYDRQNCTRDNLAKKMVYDDPSKAPYAKMMWDGKNLYILAVVYDDKLNTDESIATYNRDGVEIYVDELNEKTEEKGDATTFHQMVFALDGTYYSGDNATMEFSASKDGNMYIIEVKYTFLKLVPKKDTVIGFDVSVNVNDTGANQRDHCLSWNDQTNETYKAPCFTGNLKLTGGEGVNEGKTEETTKPEDKPTTPSDVKEVASGEVVSQYANLKWVLTSDGTITFTATKDGWNEVPYDTSTEGRWYDYADQIKKAVIGKGLAKVGAGAFKNCVNLETVEFGSISQLAPRAFVNCPKLTTIYYAGNEPVVGQVDLSKVTSLEGANVFQNCGMTSVILSNDLTKVLENRFVDCAYLTNVTFGNKTEDVNASAFKGCYNLKVLFGVKDGAVQKFAEANGMTFAEIGSKVDIPEAVVTTAMPETTKEPETTKAPETTTKPADETTKGGQKDDDKATQTGDINVAMVVAFAVAALGSAVVLIRKKRFN